MNVVSEPLVVAVDGGGSICRVCLFDFGGSALGNATGGSANITTNFEEALVNIEATVKSAYEDAGLSPLRMQDDLAYLGLAGANVGDKAKLLEKRLSFARSRVSSDREIAVEGALGDGDGTVAQVGTGSFFTTRRNGQLRPVGGWGFQLSDDCSGATLGRMLLRATIAAFDGLAPTSELTDRTLEKFSGSPGEMVTFVQTATPREYAVFAKDIAKAQKAGDPVATSILNAATARLVEILDILEAKQSGPICLLGGLGPTYLELLPHDYRTLCSDPLGSSLSGAFSLAKREFAELQS